MAGIFGEGYLQILGKAHSWKERCAVNIARSTRQCSESGLVESQIPFSKPARIFNMASHISALELWANTTFLSCVDTIVLLRGIQHAPKNLLPHFTHLREFYCFVPYEAAYRPLIHSSTFIGSYFAPVFGSMQVATHWTV